MALLHHLDGASLLIIWIRTSAVRADLGADAKKRLRTRSRNRNTCRHAATDCAWAFRGRTGGSLEPPHHHDDSRRSHCSIHSFACLFIRNRYRAALARLCHHGCPPIGALLISLLPTQGILLIDVGTAMLAIFPLFFISIPQPKRHEGLGQKQKPSLMQDVREALAYVRSWPGLVALIFMALFLNFLLVPTGSLLPLLVTKHFSEGAMELGLINSVEGFGIIAGGIILTVWGGLKKKNVVSLNGVIG